jgi:hypothetical protein
VSLSFWTIWTSLIACKKKAMTESDLVVNTRYSSTPEAEAGESQVRGQSGWYMMTFCFKKITTKRKQGQSASVS